MAPQTRDRKDYMREFMRQKREGQQAGGTLRVANTANSLECIETARALLAVLGRHLRNVEGTTDGDVLARARTAGYLVSVGLRAVEVADLEARLIALENKVTGRE